MKAIKVLALAVAGLFALSSCAKDGQDLGNTETKTVKLSFAYGEDGTRADATPIADNTPLTMSAGHIFFLDALNNIEMHIGIAKGITVGSSQVTIADLQAGEVVITGVPANVVSCAIVANDEAAQWGGATGFTGDMAGQSFSVVQNATVNTGIINNAIGDVANIPLYGIDTAADATAGTTPVGNKAYDTIFAVTLYAYGSRIQLSQVSAGVYPYVDVDGVSQTITINSYTLDGIYVNNFYQLSSLDNITANNLTLTNFGETVASYSTATGGYASTGVGYRLADDGLAMAVTAPAVAEPANGAWAYNLFPVSGAAYMPHIILKLSSVTYTDSATGLPVTETDKWVTVTGIRNAGGGAAITALEPGNTYTFGNLQFNSSNLYDAPESGMMDVLVTVTLMNWNDVPVEWNI